MLFNTFITYTYQLSHTYEYVLVHTYTVTLRLQERIFYKSTLTHTFPDTSFQKLLVALFEKCQTQY